MATILMVDTCGPTGGVVVAAWSEGELTPNGRSFPVMNVLSERTLPGRESQERLMTALAEVLQESSLQPGDVDVLAVVTGPGSFTGVRIGMAAIKGLAEALGKPVVALSRLAVLAAQAAGAGSVQAWIAAGRGDVFVGRYHDGVCLDEAMLHGADAFAALVPPDVVITMEEGLPAPDSAVRVAAVSCREALPLAVAKAQARQFADIALLDANYLRVPDAEFARQAKDRAAQATALAR